MRPHQVAFIEDCQIILSASDHGTVYLFDRRSRKTIDELGSGKGQIQALTVSALIFLFYPDSNLA